MYDWLTAAVVMTMMEDEKRRDGRPEPVRGRIRLIDALRPIVRSLLAFLF